MSHNCYWTKTNLYFVKKKQSMPYCQLNKIHQTIYISKRSLDKTAEKNQQNLLLSRIFINNFPSQWFIVKIVKR